MESINRIKNDIENGERKASRTMYVNLNIYLFALKNFDEYSKKGYIKRDIYSMSDSDI
jgi:hypothetical protein